QSCTSNCGNGSSTGRSTRAAVAPRARAWAMKSWPSTRLPGSATNRPPAWTVRASMLTLSKLASLPWRLALSGLVRSERRIASSMMVLPVLQGAFGLFDIAERVTHPMDLLIGFMPLASQQDHIPRLGAGDGLIDGLGTVGYDYGLLGSFNTGKDFI